MDPRRGRLGGIAGLVFAGGLLLQNGVLLVGMPMPGAPLDEVQAFYADRSTPIAIGVAWVAINLPALLIFVAVATANLARSEAGSVWGRVAGSAIGILGATFGVVTATQALLVARVDALAAEPAVLGLAWDIHNAAFGMSFASLAALVGSLAAGGLATGGIPRPLGLTGLAAAACLTVGALGLVPIVGGSPLIWAGMAGFVLWIAFLVGSSLSLLRDAKLRHAEATPRAEAQA